MILGLGLGGGLRRVGKFSVLFRVDSGVCCEFFRELALLVWSRGGSSCFRFEGVFDLALA